MKKPFNSVLGLNKSARFAALIVLIVAGGFLVFQLTKPDPALEQLSQSQFQSPKQAADSTLPSSSTPQDRSRNRLQAWNAVDESSIDPNLIPTYKERVEGRQLVELSTAISSWQAGEQITITIPQTGESYTPTIDQSNSMLANNISFSGPLLSDDQPYSFVITVGATSTFANISTPENSYELVGNSQYGWLMPSHNMDQHVDYDIPDVFSLTESTQGQ